MSHRRAAGRSSARRASVDGLSDASGCRAADSGCRAIRTPATQGTLRQLHSDATVLVLKQADLEAGALIVVEDASYRVRRLPIGR